MTPSPHHSKRPHLRLDGRCPVCNTAYDFQQLRILAEKEPQLLAYISCAKCGGAVLSVLTMSPQGLFAIGSLTDLLSDEVEITHRRSPVSTDDALAFHQRLEQDKGLVLDLINDT